MHRIDLAREAALAEEADLKALLIAAQSGDAGAHRRFLAEVGQALRRYFRNRLRWSPEDAEDLVQDTLIAIHTRRDSFDPAYPATAWIYAIARYRLIDHVRRTKRRGAHVPIDDGVEAMFAAEEAVEAGDPGRDVARLLDKLPAKQRSAIQLTKLEELSVREAAERLGLSESDVKISVHRGLKALTALIGAERAG